MQVTFMLEIKLQKYAFNQNMTIFLAANVSFLNHCFEWKCAYVCHKKGSEREGI